MGRESSPRVTIGKIGRTALGIALVATGLVKVGSPCAFRKAMIEARQADEQLSSVSSGSFRGDVTAHPHPGATSR